MPAARARPHTDAVVAALAAAQVLVGRGKEPAGSGWAGEPGKSSFAPYVVLYPAPGTADGELVDPNEYLDYTCQLTCVAATSEGVEAVMDAAKTALVGQRLTVAGRQCYPVYLTPLSRPISRDDQVSPPVHFGVLEIGFRTGPA